MLRCRDLTEDASRLMDGEVALPRRLRLRLHLALCAMCHTYMDQMRKTRALMATRPLAPPDRAQEDALIARITGAAPRD
jgi:anti-sigma factor RsiW